MIDKENATVASNFTKLLTGLAPKAKIPADSPSIDSFYTLDEDVKRGKLKKDIKNLEGRNLQTLRGV